MEPTRVTHRIVVLGIGNILNSDEGVGVHAVRRMQADAPPMQGIEVLDGGTLGLSLLPWVEAATHLLVLDAVDAKASPGDVVELSREQIPLFTGLKLSQHQVTFQEVLCMALVRGKLPDHIHLVGIQPRSMAIGIDLSPVVLLALPQMIDRAWSIIRRWCLPQCIG